MDLRPAREDRESTEAARPLPFPCNYRSVHVVDGLRKHGYPPERPFWTPFFGQSARTDDFITDPRVQGAKLGPTKPVYVLTSGRTFSAGEMFAYDLQALKRASIEGETTAGGVHPGDMVSLPLGFEMFVPNGREYADESALE